MRFSHAYHDIFVMACFVVLWTAGAMRTRHTRHDNSTNLSFPSKPSLQLSFSGVLQDETGGFSVKVTADESQLMILMEDAAAKNSNVSERRSEVKDRTLLDVKNNARHEHQHFFDERVCFTFDLFPSHGVMLSPRPPTAKLPYLKRLYAAQLGAAGTPTSSLGTTMRREDEDEDNESSVIEEKMTKEEMNHLLFMGALSDVFQVPLHFYAMANTSEGVKNLTDGLSCQLWSLNQTHHMPIGIMLQALTATKSIPTASPFWWVSSALEELDMKTLMEQLDLQQMKGGVATMTAAFEFCVTEKGNLLAAESLYRLTYQRQAAQEDNETSNETRTSADEEEKIMTLFEQKKATKMLHTSRPPLKTLNATEGVAGGACADLTQGSTGEQELEEDLNGEKRLQRINREADGHWDAGAYDFWDGLKVKEILSSLGTEIGPLKLALPSSRPSFLRASHGANLTELPERFDARKEWPSCNSIGLIRNQGRCGSCWAMAAATVMTDRFCVAAQTFTAAQQRGTLLSQTTEDAQKALQDLQGLSLAPELLVQCDETNNGCGGGRLDDAWTYLKHHGIPKEACAPYMHCPVPTQTSCGNLWQRPHFQLTSPSGNRSVDSKVQDICHGHCADGSLMHFFKVSEAYAVAKPRDMNSLQRELMQRGPVEVAFFVFSDFMNYRRGVYFRTPGAYGPLGGHAVRLLGWGIEEEYKKKSVDYWLIANSYSPRWGMHGLFKIRRGSNECGIETTPAAGTPDLKAVFVK